MAGLERFIDAQKGIWEDALSELEGGRKQTHWMWFIFPQLAGHGRSHRIGLLLPQRRAALNVGEQEGDHAGRQRRLQFVRHTVQPRTRTSLSNDRVRRE